MSSLSPAELQYYARHISLLEIGVAGQEKLKKASVLLVGLGGLGSPLALYLAGAGVGRLGLIEFDSVETSNLHRQVLYTTRDAAKPKLEVAAQRLRDLNPHITIETHAAALDGANARALIRKYDLVADGADNFRTRYLVNDACVLEKRPLVSASILAFEGQLSVFGYAGGPCYRCLYSQPPPEGMVPSCGEAGVLGVLPGVMGTLQATEVIKVILGLGQISSGRLLCYDALDLSFRTLKFERAKDCAVCGERPSIHDVKVEAEACAPIAAISADQLRAALPTGRYLLVDVREENERSQSKIESSVHIPLKRILAGDFSLPKDRPIVVHCAAGARSLKAAQALIQNGYPNVLNLTGGITAWLKGN